MNKFNRKQKKKIEDYIGRDEIFRTGSIRVFDVPLIVRIKHDSSGNNVNDLAVAVAFCDTNIGFSNLMCISNKQLRSVFVHGFNYISPYLIYEHPEKYELASDAACRKFVRGYNTGDRKSSFKFTDIYKLINLL